MKKFVIAGAVLAVAVLIGFTGTSVVLNNTELLAQPLPNSGGIYIPPATPVNSKPGCPNCAGKEAAVKKAQEELNGLVDLYVNGAPTSGGVARPSVEAFRSASEALKKAKKEAEECNKLKQAYCAGYDAGVDSKGMNPSPAPQTGTLQQPPKMSR